MWELDCKESWALKNWCFWTVVLEKTLESPLDCKEIQPVHPKGDQSWAFIGRTDARAETPILQPPHAKSWLTGKDPDAGRDWGQDEKRMTKDEMAGWHHHLNGHEFGWALGVGDGQGGLACCNSWGREESDMTERLNWIYIVAGQYCINFCCTAELILFYQTSLVAQLVKNLPAMRETWVQFLGWRREWLRGLENSMNYTVHGVVKSWTQLSDFHFTLPLWSVTGYWI